jgi:hypothetical protein
MSKVPSLDNTVIARKGNAGAAVTTLDPGKEDSLPPSKEGTKEAAFQGAKQGRRYAWTRPGQDEWKKTNYEMPLRVQTKIKEMKNWGAINSAYTFVAEVVEREIDKIIAKAEKEGY